MEEAVSSIREAREQLRSESAAVHSSVRTTYPDGVVVAALRSAQSMDEPGLFDRTGYIQSVAAGVGNIHEFGGAFTDVYGQSDIELECEEYSPLNDVIDDVLDPAYVFQGRTRSRLRSGPFPVQTIQDEDLVQRFVLFLFAIMIPPRFIFCNSDIVNGFVNEILCCFRPVA